MKYRFVAGALALSVLFTGCGSITNGRNVNSGFTHIENCEYADAIESFQAALEGGEDECLARRGLGIAYLHSYEYEQAAEQLLASLAADEGIVDDMDFDTNYYLAEAYMKLGEYNKSKEIYDAILALREKDKDAHFLRGVCELAAGDHDSASVDFTKAIKIDPKDYSLTIRIYKALAEYGYEDEGKSILQKAFDGGSNYMSNYEKGQVSFYLGNNAEAQSFLEAARSERDQEKEPVVLLLGATGEKQGDYNYAVSVYKTYLSENPSSAKVYNQLGMCQIRQGDYEGAISSFKEGLDIGDKPMNQALMLNEITAYEYMGEFQVASSMMAEYLKTYPEDSDAVRENVFLSTR
ncbi:MULTISPECIES: tetratricopeptide repeat protein [unclassified Butyrivibrio]|uniref:tetratricopeptide repeat protein n=1 Tax=unclassified Butyrivibrio TaxID=2639466 RepID=UPI0008EB5C99|nr:MULTISPECIES: tetratricopeptide repeat protein [unclassified Butyrivibrio]RKM63240.1 tetratricopeptide repeat protein [Butyrivibrio sp. XB500-5]SFU70932.1 Tetratricopeptide repeat-containing protein [Butyrivibrio sp. INlla21]